MFLGARLVSGRGNVVTFQKELVRKIWKIAALGGNDNGDNRIRFQENICYLEQVCPKITSSSGDHKLLHETFLSSNN